VKKQEAPVKLHEHKTEEEKKKEAEKRKEEAAKSGVNTKSNLKKDIEDKKGDDEPENRRKRSVTFGKSTTYELEGNETD
jgi:hypothetical protein